MEKLRGYTDSLVWKIILGLVAISFVLGGVGSYLIANHDTSAAKVNGVEISQRQFLQVYQNQYQRLASQMGEQFVALSESPEFITTLRNNVIDQLINEELLRQYTAKLKLGASDEQVKLAIISSPNFQQEGKFSNELYQQVLRANQLSSDQYANLIRPAIPLEQLQHAVLESDFIVPVQQDNFVKLLFQKRQVRLATYPIAEIAEQQQVSDEEIAKYYEQNKAAFLTPELIKVQYLDLNAEALQKLINVSDVEIAQYYQDNKSQFMTRGEQHLAHIQVASENEANQVYQALQNGEDFAQLAEQHSKDLLSAKNGGDLSWVVPGQLPKAFEEAADNTATGEFSKPVKVDGNYHIIKVLERKAPTALPLEQVRARIVDQVKADLLTNKFFSVEKMVAEKAFEDPASLQSAAQAGGLTIQETDFFSRNDVPAELNYANVISEMFSPELLSGEMNSNTMTVGDKHAIVVRVVAHKAEGTLSLDEAKANILDLLKRQKAEKIGLENAQILLNRLEKGESAVINFTDSQEITFAESKNPLLDQVIFAMPIPKEGQSTYRVSTNEKGDVVIIALDKVIEGSLAPKEASRITSQLLQFKANELQSILLQALRNQADVKINRDFIDQVQQ